MLLATVFVWLTWCSSVSSGEELQVPVVIIGGGIAGVSAAKKLHEAGVGFLLLEGQSALGGRMRAVEFGGNKVELGANWIHGPYTPDNDTNPLWDFKLEQDLAGTFTDYQNERLATRNGTVIDEQIVNKWWTRIGAAIEYCLEKSEELWEASEELDVPESIDITLQACLDESGYMPPGLSDIEREVALALMWEEVDFEFTSKPEDVSTMWGFPLNGDYVDKDFLVTDQRGFAHIAKQVAEPFASSVRLGQVVTKIEYNDTSVQVTTESGLLVQALYAISTLPLGVMQKGSVDFVPPFSSEKVAAINGMTMGNYAKVFLKFESNYWGNHEIFIISGEPVGFMTWGLNLAMDKYVPGSNMLNFHFAGEWAVYVETQPRTQIQAEVMAELRKQFGDDLPDPVDFLITNWTNDPMTFGSFSDWPMGYTEEEHLLMEQNEGHLYFAGEHLNGEFYGFLHGGVDSGNTVAGRVLKALEELSNDTEEPKGDVTEEPKGDVDADGASGLAFTLFRCWFMALTLSLQLEF